MDGWRVRVAATEIDDTDYIGEGRLDTVSSWAGVMSPSGPNRSYLRRLLDLDRDAATADRAAGVDREERFPGFRELGGQRGVCRRRQEHANDQADETLQ